MDYYGKNYTKLHNAVKYGRQKTLLGTHAVLPVMPKAEKTENQTATSGMSIGSLRPGMRRVDVTGRITEVETPREVQTKFGPGQVATATLQDASGTVKLTLWNENISKISEGDTISVLNGYVDSFRGELQLNVGRYGRLFVP
jgi:replication factor A1